MSLNIKTHRLLFFGIVIFLITQPVLGYGVAPEQSLTPINDPVTGASTVCVAKQSGLSLRDFALANGATNPHAISNLGELVSPIIEESLTSIPVLSGQTLLTLAVRNGVSRWDMSKLNPQRPFTGSYLAVPGTPSACLPYPLMATSFDDITSLVVKQGQVKLLAMQTAEASICEVMYLDTLTPCYPGEDYMLYAFVAINALTEPGSYPLDIILSTPSTSTELRYDLQVAPAYYGFQYIDPPPELSNLLDAQFMQEELDYLAKWRAIRTGEQQWALPLQYPLAVQTSISAEYGASRSYGGMVDGYHSGIDYRAWTGVQVLAPASGTVLLNEHLDARGNAVLIDHGWGLVTGYWHLSESLVTVGQHVERGETIALVGNTGLSTGAHLHWEVWMNGVSVDGKQWLSNDLYGTCVDSVCSVTDAVTAPLSVE